jgi:hypothetical protein
MDCFIISQYSRKTPKKKERLEKTDKVEENQENEQDTETKLACTDQHGISFIKLKALCYLMKVEFQPRFKQIHIKLMEWLNAPLPQQFD